MLQTNIPTSIQESGGAAHPDSVKLGSRNRMNNNDSRNFWNAHKIPVVAGPGKIEGLLRELPLLGLGAVLGAILKNNLPCNILDQGNPFSDR